MHNSLSQYRLMRGLGVQIVRCTMVR